MKSPKEKWSVKDSGQSVVIIKQHSLGLTVLVKHQKIICFLYKKSLSFLNYHNHLFVLLLSLFYFYLFISILGISHSFYLIVNFLGIGTMIFSSLNYGLRLAQEITKIFIE